MSATTEADPLVGVQMDELRSIIAKLEGLTERERTILNALVESYGTVLGAIRDRNTTIARLRAMLFGATTETKENVLRAAGKPPAPKVESEEDQVEDSKPKGHGRMPASAYAGARKVRIPHESLNPGDPCPVPSCSGILYEQAPVMFVRVCGCSPFSATTYEQGRLRCGLCGKTFKAKLPPEVDGGKKFDETVTSLLAVLRYGSGLPMSRIEDLQASTGVPFPVSTQWDLLETGRRTKEPVLEELVRQAAQGSVLMNDDTAMKILAYMAEEKERRDRGEPPSERTGIFTSGIVSELPEGRRVALYFTGRRHAGENLRRVLAEREAGLGPPLQMCDGLSHNAPEEFKTILSNCLVHARRQFVDVASAFPREVEHVIEEIARVYVHDREAKGLTSAERLSLHQKKSAPVMDRLKTWMQAQIDEKTVEPNSGLGKAIQYCLKRWEQLTVFLKMPGAPLDNSLTERILKRAIRHRRNSLFYKTQNGAIVGDLYMSLIATAKLAGADPFDYLTELQRHADELADNPADWMPWNYRDTLQRASPAG